MPRGSKRNKRKNNQKAPSARVPEGGGGIAVPAPAVVAPQAAPAPAQQGWGEWGMGMLSGAYNAVTGFAGEAGEQMENAGEVAESVGELSGIQEISGIKESIGNVPLIGSIADVSGGISEVAKGKKDLGGVSNVMGGMASMAKPFVSEGMGETLGTVGNVAKVGKGLHKAREASAKKAKYEDFAKSVQGADESNFPVRAGAGMMAKKHNPNEGYEEAALGAVGVAGDFMPGPMKAITTLSSKAYESGMGGYLMRGLGSSLGLSESNKEHDKREAEEQGRSKLSSKINVIQQACHGNPAEVAKLYNLDGDDSSFAKKLRKELRTIRNPKDKGERANKEAIKELIGL